MILYCSAGAPGTFTSIVIVSLPSERSIGSETNPYALAVNGPFPID